MALKDIDTRSESALALLRHLFDTAVAAVDPLIAVPPHLPPPPKGRTIVIGAGKASARMALAVERYWPGAIGGLVVTRYGHGEPCQKIEIVEAGHPVPDEAGHAAARRMLALVQHLNADDLVICLISGGGSSLLALPAPGLSLDEKRHINRAVGAGLPSGASRNLGGVRCAGRRSGGGGIRADRGRSQQRARRESYPG
jgi:glycerate 2-kinase